MSTIAATRSKTYDIVYIAVFAVIMAICSWISIPAAVPFTLQTFGVFVAVGVLGGKRGTLSVLVFILLGAIGVPVFAGFSGGVQNLIGPTGGFIISFPIMAYVIGLGVEHRKKKGMFVLMLILGTVLNYVIGVAMFCIIMNSSVMTGITACVLPFIPTAIIKAVVAALLGLQIRSRLGAALQWA